MQILAIIGSPRKGNRYRVTQQIERLLTAVGVLDGEEIVWFWIGSHKEYERVIAHPETG